MKSVASAYLNGDGVERNLKKSKHYTELAGKSALVLFCRMNSSVQYKVSTTWLFHLTFDCLY